MKKALDAAGNATVSMKANGRYGYMQAVVPFGESSRNRICNASSKESYRTPGFVNERSSDADLVASKGQSC